MFSSFLDT